MVDKKIVEEYQSLQEQFRIVIFQKESLKLQILEIENALKELENVGEEFAYKIVGNIMIKKKKEEIISELKEKKEDFEIRISNLEKMEKILEEKIKEKEEKIKGG